MFPRAVATGLSPQFSVLLVFVLLEDMTSIVTKLSDRTKCGQAMLTEGIGVGKSLSEWNRRDRNKMH